VQLRQKQMLERKLRILDSAERLIRETGETDFSVRVLAATAEVSPATPFNLFGSKEGLLYELLLRSLEVVINSGLEFKTPKGCQQAVEAAENAVQFFLDDPGFLRPLYRVLLGATHSEHRLTFMDGTYFYWSRVAGVVSNSSAFKSQSTRNAVVVSLMSHFIGLLELWVQEDLNDESFMNAARLGVLSILYPFAEKKEQTRMIGLLKEFADKPVSLNKSAGES
jgi:AcrR family transcriptional regulator